MVGCRCTATGWVVVTALSPRVRGNYGQVRLLLPDYFATPWELWARAYALYIAWRSGSSKLKSELDQVFTHKGLSVPLRQWPCDQFAPIAEAIDALLESRGWAQTNR